MKYLVLVLILLTCYHFIVEAFITPVIRKWIRYKLYEERDALRTLGMHSHISDEAYDLLSLSLNTWITNIKSLKLSQIYKFYILKDKNEAVTTEVNRRVNILSSVENDEFHRIYENMVLFAALALVANSLAWVIYLVPFLILGYTVVVVKKAYSNVKYKTRSFIEQIATLEVMQKNTNVSHQM